MDRNLKLKEKITKRQEQERRERQETILAAARKVFFEKGYLNAGMRDIALEAALSPGLIYHYYHGKDELYGAICEEAFHLLITDYLEKAALSPGSAADRLKALAKAYVRYYFDHPEYFDLISFRDLGFKKVDISKDYLSRIERLSLRALDLMRQAIKACMDEGSIRPSDDLWGLTMSLWAPVEGLLFIEKRGYLNTFGLDLDQVLDGVLAPLFKGLELEA